MHIDMGTIRSVFERAKNLFIRRRRTRKYCELMEIFKIYKVRRILQTQKNNARHSFYYLQSSRYISRIEETINRIRSCAPGNKLIASRIPIEVSA